MQELEINWGQVLRIWWLVMWRSLIFGILIGVVTGIVVGLFSYIIEIRGVAAHDFSAISGFILGGLWQIYCIRSALRKKYRGFRIALVADHS
jgi:hypothetical protein